jgi:hypothetical protein
MKIIANKSILHNKVTNATFIASKLDEMVQTGTRKNDSHIEWMGDLSIAAFPNEAADLLLTPDVEKSCFTILANTCEVTEAELLENINDPNAVLKLRWCLEGMIASALWMKEQLKSKV